jgi:uncharacterized protein YjbJ (UPF0337 family)
MVNKEQIEGKWEQLKGGLKKTWGNLTDDEIAQFRGDRQKFLGTLEEKYGVKKEEAEKRIKELENRYDYTAAA